MPVETNVPWDPESIKLPAVFVNRFQSTPFGTHLRVSFAEIIREVPTGAEHLSYRFVAMLTMEDAKLLAQVLMTASGMVSAKLPPSPTA